MNCKKCNAEFNVTSEDQAFIKKVSPVVAEQTHEISTPTLCPDCRHQRRLVWRSERKFYSRKCDKCSKDLITIFYPDQTYKVYCKECWWGDGWSAFDSGRDFDFSRPFFEQFEDLMKSTPLLYSWKIGDIENSEYNNNVSFFKNCYLMSSSNYDEDCYFGYYVNDSKDCVDCSSVKRSEIMYECLESIGGYNLKYCHNCTDCANSWFLRNCKNCKDCFGCADMTQKQYCYFNEQLTKEGYEQKLSEFNSGSKQATKEMIGKVRHHHLKYPNKHMIGEQNENVTGNVVYNSKNCDTCFDCIGSENLKYCHQLTDAKDCMDIMTWGRPAELMYECMAVGSNAYQNRFCVISQDSRENLYCQYAMFVENCFGCIGIKHAQHCILNKQYSKEEYEKLVPKIIEHMKKHGEWGEFWPSKMSPFAYNEALSNDWLPLTKEEALAQGQKWRDPDPKEFLPQDFEVADDIAQIDESVMQKIFACKKCGQNYKIVPAEFAFYKKYILPIPDECPSCRHIDRMRRRNPRHLWHRQCMNEGCQNEFETTYAPDRPEKVYCEKCYQQSVI